MKKAHQLAKELLLGPDLPVFIANAEATSMDNMLIDPQVHEFTGYDSPNGGEAIAALEIYGGKPAMG